MTLPIDVLREVQRLEEEAADKEPGGRGYGAGRANGIRHALSVLRPLLERAHATGYAEGVRASCPVCGTPRLCASCLDDGSSTGEATDP